MTIIYIKCYLLWWEHGLLGFVFYSFLMYWKIHSFFLLTSHLCLPLLYCSSFSSLCSLTRKHTLNKWIQTIPSSELPPFTNTNKHNFHSDALHKTKQKTPPGMLSILHRAKCLKVIVPCCSASIFSAAAFTSQGWGIWRVPWVKHNSWWHKQLGTVTLIFQISYFSPTPTKVIAILIPP